MQSTNNITDSGIEYKIAKPVAPLYDFVESYWMLENTSDTAHETIGLPDGRFDIIFSYSSNEPFHAMLMGLGTESGLHSIPPKIVMFAVSFKLLAIEYLLGIKAASILNTAQPLPADFWNIQKSDLDDFDNFCEKLSSIMLSLIKPDIDNRKQKLFDLIYDSNGSLSVKELSDQVFWSSRQINRYFNEQFGISLKAYCNILRFKNFIASHQRRETFSRIKLYRPNAFHKRSKEIFRRGAERIIQKPKRPIYTIIRLAEEIVLHQQNKFKSMLLQNKQIAIVGGGPGGLTLARLLQMKGTPNAFGIKVYERDLNKDARVQGTTLDLHEDSGLRALREASLLEEFKKNYRPGADRMIIVNENAEIFFSDHEGKPEADFGSEHFRPEIDRGPLRKMLLESLQPGTVVWDSQFVSMEKQNDGWLLHFKNGTSAYADIVIGADGGNSKIRPYITQIKPFYSDISGLMGSVYNPETTAPDIHKLLKDGKIMAFGGGKFFCVASKGDGSLAFYLSYKTDEHHFKNLDLHDKTEMFSWFKNDFSEWGNVWHELFENVETPLMPIPIYCMPVNQTWKSLPNLTMLGDAAHLMPPFAGEGVNMAMLDALELSECLCTEKFSDIQTAVASYENQMRKRAAAAAQASLENGDRMHSSDALQTMLSFFDEVQKIIFKVNVNL